MQAERQDRQRIVVDIPVETTLVAQGMLTGRRSEHDTAFPGKLRQEHAVQVDQPQLSRRLDQNVIGFDIPVRIRLLQQPQGHAVETSGQQGERLPVPCPAKPGDMPSQRFAFDPLRKDGREIGTPLVFIVYVKFFRQITAPNQIGHIQRSNRSANPPDPATGTRITLQGIMAHPCHSRKSFFLNRQSDLEYHGKIPCVEPQFTIRIPQRHNVPQRTEQALRIGQAFDVLTYGGKTHEKNLNDLLYGKQKNMERRRDVP